MSDEPKSYGPIGADQHCLCCAQARTAEHVDCPPGTDRHVASAVAACLSTLEAIEREGFHAATSSLCGPCREAFEYIQSVARR